MPAYVLIWMKAATGPPWSSFPRLDENRGPPGSLRIIQAENKYMVEKLEREADWFVCCGKRKNERDEGCEEWADLGALLATQGYGDIQTKDVMKSHI